ncbi:MAG: response regulator, partial [Proteobacteria bacterium]|nr:response regulator [Pseudomonadota bacterium]
QGESILVIDDLLDQRELTTAVLERLNYKVTTCATGQEALDQLKENDFDLVILDMVTNDEWDGLQSFREIISLKPDIRTLLVSGFAETEQVAEAQQLGAGPFLRKPFTLEGIGSRIKSLLG